MKISQRLIINIALEVFEKKYVVTQKDIHMAIEEYLQRQLTIGEKIRITRILESHFYLEKVERDNLMGVRIYIFKR